MQNAEGDRISAQSGDRNVGYNSVVSDLESLIGHIQASMKLVESAIATGTPLNNLDVAADVVVLDDVTPRYQNARAALGVCSRSLEVTLHLLCDSESSQDGTDESAAHDPRPVGLAGGT